MPRRRKKRLLKPRTPARVKKKTRSAKPRGHQHPELIGLGLAAVGAFLATVLYLGWSGGFVGALAADALDAVIGAARYVAPVALLVYGGPLLTPHEPVGAR